MKHLMTLAALLGLSGCGAIAMTGVNEIKASSDWNALAAYDADGSDTVSVAEFSTLRRAAFQRFDSNSDGQWSGAEYRAVLDQLPARRRVGSGELLGILREPVQFADTNGDGMISQPEFSGGDLRLFTLLDRNGDGVLVRQDFSKTRL